MGNITDDIRNDFAVFADRPFNEVDSLALSQLAYARMPQDVPRHPSANMVPLHTLLRAEAYDAIFGSIWSPQMNVELIRAMSESPRWRHIRIGGYVDEYDADEAMQFSACTFDLGDGRLYIAFRGTDGSIMGWKEDFMMAFRRPIASQEAAARYLREVAARWHGMILVGGHSKGGNLAIYAAAEAPADVQERIEAVYSHDGPGFDPSFLEGTGFARIASKIHKTVPEASIVGMLFERGDASAADRFTVVKSAGVSIMQHFGLNWQVKDGVFVRADGLNASAQYASGVINDWMDKYDDERRRLFIENLFAILESGGYRTFGELTAHWTQSLPAMILATRNVASDERDAMVAIVGGLISSAVKPGPVERAGE
ncbi:DUF2974 domain-containing protein [Bifidobacterium vespertilionis]|uniref:DUF2974 domain-containing protein n=1 Tax=Bifidobacterium vespertilionis TaxID=2562524 RepID=A0A5J5DZU6_9BIFI|nr:DUF2974 domain-containing protein [Bifidobacterium vespertilionis]KAA8822059.1 DUF2974 domain-containing protein [Bifidobacterium vespertilionis]KAA8824578.1 DUF2974 domain-containing protein [Bifidobacterium vespertilionis]